MKRRKAPESMFPLVRVVRTTEVFVSEWAVGSTPTTAQALSLIVRSAEAVGQPNGAGSDGSGDDRQLPLPGVPVEAPLGDRQDPSPDVGSAMPADPATAAEVVGSLARREADEIVGDVT